MIDVFLKLEGIKGESKDGKHKDAIDVNGFKWAVDQVGVQNMGGGGGGAGKTTVGDIVILKQIAPRQPCSSIALRASTSHARRLSFAMPAIILWSISRSSSKTC